MGGAAVWWLMVAASAASGGCGSPPASPTRPALADVVQAQDDHVYVAARPPPLPAVEAERGMKPTKMAGGNSPPIRVIDPGTEPRRVLVYAPVPASSETVELITDDPKMGAPAVVTVDLEIVDVRDGWISARMKIVSAYAEPRPGDWRSAEESTAIVAKVVGSRLATTTDVFGRVGEAVMTATSEASSMMRRRDLRFHWTVPLPREAVGEGARWESAFDLNGLHVVETTTLTKVDEERAWLSQSVEYTHLDDGSPSSTHASAEWEIRLDRLCASGSSRVWTDGEPDRTIVMEQRRLER